MTALNPRAPGWTTTKGTPPACRDCVLSGKGVFPMQPSPVRSGWRSCPWCKRTVNKNGQDIPPKTYERAWRKWWLRRDVVPDSKQLMLAIDCRPNESARLPELEAWVAELVETAILGRRECDEP
jgi:hypothetical protein